MEGAASNNTTETLATQELSGHCVAYRLTNIFQLHNQDFLVNVSAS